MNICQRVGENLKRLRTAHGWSQEEMADRSGLHRTYISSLERGLRNPTVTVLEKLASAFGSKIGVLTDH